MTKTEQKADAERSFRMGEAAGLLRASEMLYNGQLPQDVLWLAMNLRVLLEKEMESLAAERKQDRDHFDVADNLYTCPEPKDD